MNRITVALVNDYEVVVRGLASMLRTYRDSVDIVELDANVDVARSVDVALYDTFAAPQGDRAEVRDLVSNPLVGKVAVYSWNTDPALVEGALRNGAHGYIPKSMPARHVVSALYEIHAGGRPVPSGPPTRTTVVRGDWVGREEGLSPREAEVLALITQGLSNVEIAQRTHLSINSVKSYIRNCYRRLGLGNRTQAVLWGVEHGFRPDHVRVQHPKRE